jgi:hypothetical protein
MPLKNYDPRTVSLAAKVDQIVPNAQSQDKSASGDGMIHWATGAACKIDVGANLRVIGFLEGSNEFLLQLESYSDNQQGGYKESCPIRDSYFKLSLREMEKLRTQNSVPSDVNAAIQQFIGMQKFVAAQTSSQPGADPKVVSTPSGNKAMGFGSALFESFKAIVQTGAVPQ